MDNPRIIQVYQNQSIYSTDLDSILACLEKYAKSRWWVEFYEDWEGEVGKRYNLISARLYPPFDTDAYTEIVKQVVKGVVDTLNEKDLAYRVGQSIAMAYLRKND